MAGCKIYWAKRNTKFKSRSLTENCIVLADQRNRRNIEKLKNIEIEKCISSIKKSIQIGEVKKKQRDRVNLTANTMIITCTIRALLKELNGQGISVSLGKVLHLRPFFVTYPSDKEVSLRLCKLCLNTKLLFECLKTQPERMVKSLDIPFKNSL